ncbi:N-6 DNA methylase [Paenalcaligenes sp. Me131]|uniref:N-6 DNA methylase n=1 Tax=Paenalcaligenes sp. Me131 TaxID=3392636 RepID=UPI003D2A9ADE
MSKAQKNNFFRSADEHQQAVVKTIEGLSRTHGLDRVWSDWVEISAIALARLDKAQFDRREERYLQIVKSYSKAELEQLVQAFSHLVMAFDYRVKNGEITDVLGSIFMALNMGNSRSGQFFTPFEVSYLMAKITAPENHIKNLIEANGYVTLAEPTSGAGGMIIAYARTMKDDGHNYQQTLHVTATDIDSRCVHMTFVQMALLHIPGIVIHGNALSLEEWGHWFTPAHIIGGWSRKLRQSKHTQQTMVMPASNARTPTLPLLNQARELGQIQLF